MLNLLTNNKSFFDNIGIFFRKKNKPYDYSHCLKTIKTFLFFVFSIRKQNKKTDKNSDKNSDKNKIFVSIFVRPVLRKVFILF